MTPNKGRLANANAHTYIHPMPIYAQTNRQTNNTISNSSEDSKTDLVEVIEERCSICREAEWLKTLAHNDIKSFLN
jgi:hypothetical protein